MPEKKVSLRRFMLAFLLLAVGPATALTITDPQTNVEITAPAEYAANVRAAVFFCNHAVDEFLGPVGRHKTPPRLKIRVGEAVSPADAPDLLHLPADATWLSLVHHVSRALFARRLLMETGNTPSADSIQWLAAAAAYAVIHCRQGIEFTLPPNYQPIRDLLYNDGFITSPESLILLPASPQWENVYRLYAMNCHLLVNVLRSQPARNAPSLLHRLSALLASGMPAGEALRSTLKPNLRTNQSVHDWYIHVAGEEARRGRHSISADQVAVRIQKILQVSVLLPGPQKRLRYRTLNLRDAFRQLEDYEMEPRVVASKEQQLQELLKDAPVPMKEAVATHIQAVHDFARHRDRRRLERDLSRADRSLQQALADQARIDEYLDRIERSFLLPEQSLGGYLRAVQDEQARKRQLAPEIHQFLDAIAD